MSDYLFSEFHSRIRILPKRVCPYTHHKQLNYTTNHSMPISITLCTVHGKYVAGGEILANHEGKSYWQGKTWRISYSQ